MRDLTRDEIVSAVWAWTYVLGCGESWPEALPRSLRWLLSCWENGQEHVPLTLVHDLGHLLVYGREFRFASSRELSAWPADERAARLAYEDRLLGRWAMDPTVTEAHVVIAGTAAALREPAVSHAIGLALAGPLRDLGTLVRGNAASLRTEIQTLCAQIPGSFAEAARRIEPAWRAWALAQLGAYVQALGTERLFHSEELWEIAHLCEVPNDSARLALREIHAAAARAGPVAPSVALALRRRAREVPVEREEASSYPSGGFDAVGTQGALENLVRTEVAYVGEGRTNDRGIDLFDLRLAQGELLFYTRDESPMLDARREITAVIDRPAELRVKRPALSAQTLVLVQGVVLALHADMLRLFGPSGARLRTVFRAVSTEDIAAADEECARMGVSLAQELAHRRAEIARVERWEDVPEIHRVVFSSRPPDEAVGHLAWVRVGGDTWSLGPARFDLAGSPEALRALCDALLERIADGVRAEVPGSRRAPRRG